MELVKEGVYFGTVEEHGFMEGKTGDVKAFVKVSFTTEDKTKATLTWFGGFSTQKSAEYTKKTIHDLSGMILLSSGVFELPTGKPVKITVEHNEYNGKVSAKIKYLNSASSKFKGVSPEKFSALAWVDQINVEKQESDLPF